MQTQWLERHPSAPVRVYAVWLPMLFGDSRAAWNGNVMPDARVEHFWDGDRAVGSWFAENVEGFEGVVWDAYYLYGPEAEWDAIPGPLAGSGSTILGERDMLEAELRAIVGE